MGTGILGIDRVSEPVAVLGKSLDQVKAIAQHEQGEAGSERLAADELLQLFPGSRLVVDRSVEKI
jgi:hypothetical protein